MLDANLVASAPSPSNRLSIGFLLTWTLCTAVSFAIDRWDFSVHSDTPTDVLAYWTAYSLAFRPLSGVCIAFALLTLKRLVFRQLLLPAAPGHWYLLSAAVLLALVRTEDVLLLAAPTPTRAWLSESNYRLWQSVPYGASAAAAILGALAMRASLWWRLMLVMESIYLLRFVLIAWNTDFIGQWELVQSQIDILSPLIGSISALLSVVAVIWDIRIVQRHDFYHWLGVLTLWALTLLSWPSLYWYAAVHN